MRDLFALQKGDQEGPRNLQDVCRLLRRQHLADRDKSDGIAAANVPQQVHQHT